MIWWLTEALARIKRVRTVVAGALDGTDERRALERATQDARRAIERAAEEVVARETADPSLFQVSEAPRPASQLSLHPSILARGLRSLYPWTLPVDTLLQSDFPLCVGQCAVRQVTVFRDGSHNCEKTTERSPGRCGSSSKPLSPTSLVIQVTANWA